MTSRVVLPAKAIGEAVNYQIDFLSELSEGEVLESATCSLEVYCGTDATPSAMLNGAARVSGSVVTQQLIDGTRGVIYVLSCVGVTDLLQIITIKAYLAAIDPDTDMPMSECCTRIGVATSANGKDYIISFPDNPISAYRDGLPLYVIFDDTCTLADPTLNPDNLGAKDINLTTTVAVSAYQILEGDLYQLVYSEDLDTWTLLGRIPTQEIAFKQADTSTVLTTGTKFTMQGMKTCFILGVRAGVTTVSSAGPVTWALKNNATTFATITIDQGENTSVTGSSSISDRTHTGPWPLAGEITAAGASAVEWDVILTVRFEQ